MSMIKTVRDIEVLPEHTVPSIHCARRLSTDRESGDFPVSLRQLKADYKNCHIATNLSGPIGYGKPF